MAQYPINLKDFLATYQGDVKYLTPVKGATPFGFYDNDPEFVRDAKNVVRFISNRLGAGAYGASGARMPLNITELTVYSAFEEAVTTYGNLVYQYKIRDNYINMEGSETAPFSNVTNTLVNSIDINRPISWSAPRLATYTEIGKDPAYSQSIVDGRIWAISASISDFIIPDFNKIKTFTFATQYYDQTYHTYLDLSQYVYNNLNRLGGATVITPYWNSNSASFDFSSYTNNNSTFNITGSNGVQIQFVVTSSAPADTATTFYILTGSNAGDTANNISNKITSVSYGTFGTLISAVTGSPTTTLSFTSSLSYYNLNNFKINGTQLFTNTTSGSLYTVDNTNTHVYFYVTNPTMSGGSPLFISASVTQSIPTVYLQADEQALNGKLLTNNFTTIQTQIADEYAAEAGVGGRYITKKGSFLLQQGIQDYDLNAWAAASESLAPGDTIQVSRVFYEAPPAIVRYFDPYAGTGTGIQSLLETFGFGQMSPGINFLLMPVYFDVMKVQAIEFNDQIRKAAYSFDLKNNQLRLFPVPNALVDGLPLFFEYEILSQKNSIVKDERTNVISDVMNVPYRNPTYMEINTVGRMWIFRYTLALCKEIEGQIKVTNDTVTVNNLSMPKGNDFLVDARQEKQDLINELKEMLNEVSRKGQLERKQAESGFLRDIQQQIPLPIYIM